MANKKEYEAPVTTINKENADGVAPRTKEELDDLLVEYYGKINPGKYKIKKENGEFDREYEKVGFKATAETYKNIERRAIEERLGEAREDIEFELKGEKPIQPDAFPPQPKQPDAPAEAKGKK